MRGREGEKEGERSLENHGHLLTSADVGISELSYALKMRPSSRAQHFHPLRADEVRGCGELSK